MNYFKFEQEQTAINGRDNANTDSISSFVLSELPRILTSINRGETQPASFENAVRHLLQRQRETDLNEATSTPAKRDLLLLDCLMIERGLTHSSAQVPEELITFIEKLAVAAGRLPTMTYEDVILVNPLQKQPRTFSIGEVAKSEQSFYELHRSIEHSLETAIEMVTTAGEALKTLGGGGVSLAVEKLKVGNQALDRMLEIASTAPFSIPRDHFASFRKYFTTHPTRGFKGPSGAFSGNLPLLELSIAGKQLPQEFIGYLTKNIDYFPRDSAQKIKEKLEQLQNPEEDDSIMTINYRSCMGFGYTYVKEELAGMLEKVHKFRGYHYKMVKHHLPEALPGRSAGTIAGTAGEIDVHGFLIKRLKMRFTI